MICSKHTLFADTDFDITSRIISKRNSSTRESECDEIVIPNVSSFTYALGLSPVNEIVHKCSSISTPIVGCACFTFHKALETTQPIVSS